MMNIYEFGKKDAPIIVILVNKKPSEKLEIKKIQELVPKYHFVVFYTGHEMNPCEDIQKYVHRHHMDNVYMLYSMEGCWLLAEQLLSEGGMQSKKFVVENADMFPGDLIEEELTCYATSLR